MIGLVIARKALALSDEAISRLVRDCFVSTLATLALHASAGVTYKTKGV
jgi:hypothetical protein